MKVEVVAERQTVDDYIVDEQVELESRRLGIRAFIRWVDDVRADYGDAAVVVAGLDTPDLDDLPHPAVRVDLGLGTRDRSPNVVTHIHGRGIAGVLWGIRTVVNHDRWPSRRLAYGEHPEQFGELWLPEKARPAPPVAVLLHGGFWRSKWELDLMDALSVDLAERGIAAWNVEYRRPDKHGWAATVADVEAAVRYVPELPGVDHGRVGLIGHSAGGQLAARVAADLVDTPARPTLVVVLAGVMDLIEAQKRDLGEGAVAMALGGTHDELSERYEESSPMARLPLGTRQIVVTASDDSVDLNEMNSRYAAGGIGFGDRVNLRYGYGGHFSLIDPEHGLWTDTAEELTMILMTGEWL